MIRLYVTTTTGMSHDRSGVDLCTTVFCGGGLVECAKDVNMACAWTPTLSQLITIGYLVCVGRFGPGCG